MNNMKKLIVITLLIALLVGQGALAAKKKDLNISVKKLYSAPHDDSNLIYEIPVEVALLDISKDGNWYKVKIAYNIGPFNYTYVGWAEIPVADILAKRAEKAPKIAQVSKEK